MRRLVTVTFWRADGWKLAVAVIVAGLAVAAGTALRTHDTRQIDGRICTKIDRLDGVIVALLERSQKALPANPYYREHPELLAAAERENARALREFRGAAC